MKKVAIPKEKSFARVRVIGVGGSGKNATNHMVKNGIKDVEFVVANTDAQDLEQSKAGKKIHLGKKTTRGLGTGMNWEKGRKAAEENKEEIMESLKGADIVFIACGMGGGTGTGASPVIARLAHDLGILTVAVVTTPFSFEGNKRRKVAEGGIKDLSKNVDALVVISNDNILENVTKDTSVEKAFALSDDVLLHGVQSISDLIANPGDINIDFADLKSTLKNSGIALLGVGMGKGKNRVQKVVETAISPKLLNTNIRGAKKLLFSIASSSRKGVSMNEIQDIAEEVTKEAHEDATIIFGTTTDKTLKKGEIRLTVIASSFEDISRSSIISEDFTEDFGSNDAFGEDFDFSEVESDYGEDILEERRSGLIAWFKRLF